ncbi:MAG: thioredoxin [Planctomycetota bacterium]|nr:MAG: thioredoxin [Planctomycetota bacterium]
MTTPTPGTPDVLTLGDADFDAALTSADRPLLVDFHATWCPPCRALAPTLERLAVSHADRVRVGKVDIDDNPALVERFSIASVPTLLLLRGDELLERITGNVGAAELAARVEAHT